ncbi:MAG: DUF2325 domain-containing protein [Deltaproteobacteria bacterium]|nr:DUF2325 domain-containing protein [Deltaproteobacteria bacterium]
MAHSKRIRQPLSGMGQFVCSIIGTCLTLKETEKMVRRFGYAGDRSPYQLHSWAVEACQKVPEVAKFFQKYLTGKYRLIMNHIDEFEGEDLGRAWSEAVREGRIAGAYWAILTRMDAPEEIISRIFGEVHMMSHLQGSETRDEIKELGQLRQDYDDLKERATGWLSRLETVRREREELKRRLVVKENETLDLGRKLMILEQRLASLAVGQDLERLKRENQELSTRLAREQKAREKLEMRLFQGTVRQLPRASLDPEIKIANTDELEPPAEICPLAEGGDCSRFCDKCILFVGGLDRLEPHYRSLVEGDFAGRFMRHDGDCHNGRGRLIHMVNRAEAVICPLNCISHQAYLCVKKLCKDLNKPCVLLRNSGLGSLRRALMELAGSRDPAGIAQE